MCWPSAWKFLETCAAFVMLLGGSNGPWQEMCVLNMLGKMFLVLWDSSRWVSQGGEFVVQASLCAARGDWLCSVDQTSAKPPLLTTLEGDNENLIHSFSAPLPCAAGCIRAVAGCSRMSLPRLLFQVGLGVCTVLRAASMGTCASDNPGQGSFLWRSEPAESSLGYCISLSTWKGSILFQAFISDK